MTPTEAAELRAENARLREALAKIAASPLFAEFAADAAFDYRDIARAALTPRPPRADAAPHGWDTGENVR